MLRERIVNFIVERETPRIPARKRSICLRWRDTLAIFILLLNIAMRSSCIHSHIPNRSFVPPEASFHPRDIPFTRHSFYFAHPFLGREKNILSY